MKSHLHLSKHHHVVLGVVRTIEGLTAPEIAEWAARYMPETPASTLRLRVARCLTALHNEGFIEVGPKRNGFITWNATWPLKGEDDEQTKAEETDQGSAD